LDEIYTYIDALPGAIAGKDEAIAVEEGWSTPDLIVEMA
jgi:hypothetical protein